MDFVFDGFFVCIFLGHAHLTDFNIATIIKDGERATALAGTKPYMGNSDLQLHYKRLIKCLQINILTGKMKRVTSKKLLYSGHRRIVLR